MKQTTSIQNLPVNAPGDASGVDEDPVAPAAVKANAGRGTDPGARPRCRFGGGLRRQEPAGAVRGAGPDAVDDAPAGDHPGRTALPELYAARRLFAGSQAAGAGSPRLAADEPGAHRPRLSGATCHPRPATRCIWASSTATARFTWTRSRVRAASRSRRASANASRCRSTGIGKALLLDENGKDFARSLSPRARAVARLPRRCDDMAGTHGARL